MTLKVKVSVCPERTGRKRNEVFGRHHIISKLCISHFSVKSDPVNYRHRFPQESPNVSPEWFNRSHKRRATTKALDNVSCILCL